MWTIQQCRSGQYGCILHILKGVQTCWVYSRELNMSSVKLRIQYIFSTVYSKSSVQYTVNFQYSVQYMFGAVFSKCSVQYTVNVQYTIQ